MSEERIVDIISGIDEKYLDEASEYINTSTADNLYSDADVSYDVETIKEGSVSTKSKIISFAAVAGVAAVAAIAAIAIISPFNIIKDNTPPVFSENKVSPVTDFEFVKENGSVKIIRYIGSQDTVVIPERIDDLPVKYIAENAFSGTFITTAVIPESVISIGESAFMDCSMLKEVIILDSVEKIGDCCFKNCVSLEKITFSKNLKYIGDEAFAYCSKLKVIDIPEGVTEIGSGAFRNNPLLKRIVIPESIKVLEAENLFTGCFELESVVFPEGFTKFTYTYQGSPGAFKGCSKLNNISLPASFNDPDIARVLSDNLDLVAEFDEDNKYMKSVNGEIYSPDGTILYYAVPPANKPDNIYFNEFSYFVDTDVMEIKTYAFVNFDIRTYNVYLNENCNGAAIVPLGSLFEATAPERAVYDAFMKSLISSNCPELFFEGTIHISEVIPAENNDGYTATISGRTNKGTTEKIKVVIKEVQRDNAFADGYDDYYRYNNAYIIIVGDEYIPMQVYFKNVSDTINENYYGISEFVPRVLYNNSEADCKIITDVITDKYGLMLPEMKEGCTVFDYMKLIEVTAIDGGGEVDVTGLYIDLPDADGVMHRVQIGKYGDLKTGDERVTLSGYSVTIRLTEL